ncbi:DUF5686 family protein [Porphyromonas cangingivalis]|uniref:Bacterial surface antigen (D15) domain-containing protein n=1 Tax=Porphyromonas cangingivalis TaxID=36874 RepID=A0A1T4JML5_PORCN|nr:DUF5686 family protein [Porphyromonas cangingivalis]SJZ31255.1 hypothetical protein SAMN02745205_00089 [Porphyromonas cangingivalis]VEJ04391.1 Uncharacterised protein [Porphyromonas cangingivalis]
MRIVITVLRMLSGLLLPCLLTSSLHAQEYDWARLKRYRPTHPYDEDMGYVLLDMLSASESSRSPVLRRLPSIAFGPTVRVGCSTLLGLDGVANLFPDFNDVDGLWLGYEMQLDHSLSEGRKIMFRTSQNYTLKTRRWFSENNILIYHSPKRDGLLVLSGGHTSRETVHMAPYELFTEQYVGLPGTNSDIHHYRKWYVSTRHKLYLSPHFRYSALLQYEDRSPQVFGTDLVRHRALTSELRLIYNLKRNHKERPSYPTPIVMPAGQDGIEAGLTLRAGITPTKTEDTPFSEYKMWEVSLRSAQAFSPNHKVDFLIIGGSFWDQGWQSDADMRHFPRLSLMGRSNLGESWHTLPAEWMGTKRWMATGINYYANHFLLGLFLPVDEGLHLRSLHLSGNKDYIEGGYSVGFGRMARIGLFVGSDLVEPPNVAVRISLPFIYLISTWSERY